MADEKKEMDLEEGKSAKNEIKMPNLPKPINLDEKKYLLAVERGDMANVKRIIQKAHRHPGSININCVDPLGRGALLMAIDNENLEMVELLVVLGVETRDALLHAINAEFVEAVELLLEHEELIHKEGEPYSWERMDWNIATFSPDITPLILAAHKNNYEILKILLDRGATLPMPHDIKCGCDECIRSSEKDSLMHSLSRVNAYRALASPSLISLSSSDPILTAFELSWDLRNLAFAEPECKQEYMELRRQCQKLAVDLLQQTRSSTELAVVLNHDPDSTPYEDGEHMKLARLELAIAYKQKKFVAHQNIQQLLAAIWYEGLPGFRRKPMVAQCFEIAKVALLFPFYCVLYMVAPNTAKGKLMRKPFMKFLIHASSYLFFLLILVLVTQRFEIRVIQILGTEAMKTRLEEQLLKQRGNGPTILECLVMFYVIGFIWEEIMEIVQDGIRKYLRDLWNFIDFSRNSLYVGMFFLRVVAYIQQNKEISLNPSVAYIPREQWDDFDPQLVAEGLFAAANVLSALKLVHLFSVNPHLGPLQISLGRMIIDIIKFLVIYSLVLFAFACGLNQLLWYFAELERQKCYSLPGGLPDWDNKGDSCSKWRRFGNLFESSQSLFWASFGMIGLEEFQLQGIKTYTRFWGLLMFGSYSVINVIVLLNLLIAMMSNSYAAIVEHADTEWKFARTKLWMSYFEESATLPTPFNIIPTPKHLLKWFGLRKKDKLRRMSSKRKEHKEKERDFRYTAVMRALVWRYVSNMHRKCDENPVTEDDINEVKGEITAMRYEMLEVFQRNGMDVSSADKKKDAVLGKKMKVWERRLMKDFQVAPVVSEDMLEELEATPPENEEPLAKWRRLAKIAVVRSSSFKWGQVVRDVCMSSQIGKCSSRQSFKKQQNLQIAMEEAKKIVQSGVKGGGSPGNIPMPLPDTTGSNIISLLSQINDDDRAPTPQQWRPPGKVGSSSALLSVISSAQSSRPCVSPSDMRMSKSPVAPKRLSPESKKKDLNKSMPTSPMHGPKIKGHDCVSPSKKCSGPSDTSSQQTKTSAESQDKEIRGKPSSQMRKSSNADAGQGLSVEEVNAITVRRDSSAPKVIKRKPIAALPPQAAPEHDQNLPSLPPPPSSLKRNANRNLEDSIAIPRPSSPIPTLEVTLASASVTPASTPAVTPRPIHTPFSPPSQQSQQESGAGGSTEKLIPEDKLRAGKVEDVRTIKRQPKGGWL